MGQVGGWYEDGSRPPSEVVETLTYFQLRALDARVRFEDQLHPADGLIAYPAFTEYHRPLADMAMRIRADFIQGRKEIMTLSRMSEVARLGRFFGFDPEIGKVVVIPAAMTAVGWGIEVFSKPGDSIIVLSPAYPAFEELTRLADYDRQTIHVDCTNSLNVTQIEIEINNARRNRHTVDVIVLNQPRNPDYFMFDAKSHEQLSMLADKYDITILYDEVLVTYDEGCSFDRSINIETGKIENHMLTRVIQRARSHMTIRDSGKILPNGIFTKVAVIQLSNASMSKGGDILTGKNTRYLFDTPDTLELYILAEVLHSESFLPLLGNLRNLHYQNFKILQQHLSFPIFQCGPYALIDLSGIFSSYSAFKRAMNDVGIVVRAMGEYYPSDKPLDLQTSCKVRLSLTMDPEPFTNLCERFVKHIRDIYYLRTIGEILSRNSLGDYSVANFIY